MSEPDKRRSVKRRVQNYRLRIWHNIRCQTGFHWWTGHIMRHPNDPGWWECFNCHRTWDADNPPQGHRQSRHFVVR